MVRFLHDEPAVAQAVLAAHGVELVAVSQVHEQLAVHRVLTSSESDVRVDVVITAPDDVDADSGNGAWHVNAQHEAHTVLEGVGVIEFWCDGKAVGAMLEPGDIMLVKGAEHRYRPLTDQRWLIRYSGGPNEELTATQTGRASEPWPVVTFD